MPVRFEVNGKQVAVEVEPRMTLVDCLRHELRLTGTHVGCEHGVCGACTILVDGEAVRGCLMLAVQGMIDPSGNVHASPDYQRHIAGVLAQRAISAAYSRAGHAI